MEVCDGQGVGEGDVRVERERVKNAGFAAEKARVEGIVDVFGEVVVVWDVGC